MPPAVSLVLAAVHVVFLQKILGDLWYAFFASYVIGYLCYDYTHYAVHHFTPRTRFGHFIKKFHMEHHFLSQESRWGVSSPLWDIVFGTMTNKK